jgi:hypothetical protein
VYRFKYLNFENGAVEANVDELIYIMKIISEDGMEGVKKSSGKYGAPDYLWANKNNALVYLPLWFDRFFSHEYK